MQRRALTIAFVLAFVLAPFPGLIGARFSQSSAILAYGSGSESPNVVIVSPNNRTYCANSIGLTFAVKEAPLWIGYSLDEQANVTIAGYVTLVGLSIGAHSLTVYMNGSSGFMARSETVHFAIDTVPPAVTVLSPEGNKTYAINAVPLRIIVDEEISWSGYSLDGQETVTASEDLNLTELSGGRHSLVVYARDIAGNIGTSETIYFNVVASGSGVLELWVLAIVVVIVAAGSTILIYRLKTNKRNRDQPTNVKADQPL